MGAAERLDTNSRGRAKRGHGMWAKWISSRVAAARGAGRGFAAPRLAIPRLIPWPRFPRPRLLTFCRSAAFRDPLDRSQSSATTGASYGRGGTPLVPPFSILLVRHCGLQV